MKQKLVIIIFLMGITLCSCKVDSYYRCEIEEEMDTNELEDSCISFFNRHPEYIAWTQGENRLFINPNHVRTKIIPRKKTMRPMSDIHKYYFRLPLNDSVTVTLLTGLYAEPGKSYSANLYIGAYAYNNEKLRRWKNHKEGLTEEQRIILNLLEDRFFKEIKITYTGHTY